MSAPKIIVCPDSQSLNERAAQYFVDAASEAIAARGKFIVALSGGSTPKALYELLATPLWQTRIDWSQVHIFWGDERLVPSDHNDSNYRMVRLALLSKVPLAEINVHRVPTELGDPDAVAAAYEQTIRQDFGDNTGEIPRFDLCLLGLGENGHTASLFPYSKSLQENRKLVVADFIKEMNAYRITMTVPLLNNARRIAFLVLGAVKSAIVEEVIKGHRDPENLPAQLVQPTDGTLVWIMDEAAAAALPPELAR